MYVGVSPLGQSSEKYAPNQAISSAFFVNSCNCTTSANEDSYRPNSDFILNVNG